jgi:hypothetical protein
MNYPSYGINYYSSGELDRLIRTGFSMDFTSMNSLGDTNGTYSLDPVSITDVSDRFTGAVSPEIIGGKLGIDNDSTAISTAAGIITSGGHVASVGLIPNSSVWSVKILFGNVYCEISSTQNIEIGLFDGTDFTSYASSETSVPRNVVSYLSFRWDGKDRFRAYFNNDSIYHYFDEIDIFGEIPVLHITGNVVTEFNSKVASGFTIDNPIGSQRGATYGNIRIDGYNIKWPIDDATPTQDSDGGLSLSAALEDLASDGLSPFITIDHCPYSLQDPNADPVPGGIVNPGNESDYADAILAIAEAGYASGHIILLNGPKFLTYEDLSSAYSAAYYAIKSEFPSSNIYGPNIHLIPLNDGYDEDFGGFTVDSRLMDGLTQFINDPDIEFDGLAIGAQFGSPAEWSSFIEFIKDFTDKRIVLTTIFDDQISNNFLYQESGQTDNVIVEGSLNVNFGYNINPTGNNNLEVVVYPIISGGTEVLANQTLTWSFDSDPSSSVSYSAGIVRNGVNPIVSHEFDSVGTYNIKLEVYDSGSDQNGEFFTTIVINEYSLNDIIDAINLELDDDDIAFISDGFDTFNIYTGTSAPTNVIGDHGDLYVQESPLKIYGPKNTYKASYINPWGPGQELTNYTSVVRSTTEPVDETVLWIAKSPDLFSLLDFRNLSNGGIPALTNGDGSNDPANVIDLATLYNPNPDPGNCQDPNNYVYPSPPSGAMQYLNYDISTTDINKVEAEFMIISDVSGAEETYFQFYECDIDSSHQYFGVQTDATFGGGQVYEQLLIFSKFLNRPGDPLEYRVFGDATGLIGTNEGDYVSVRLVTTLTSGQWYTVDVRRAEYEALTIDSVTYDGDWFDYYIDGTRVAGIWFERSSPSVAASFDNVGASWTEYWANNNNTTLYTVPEQEFRLRPLKFNDTLPYGDSTITSAYSPMPNTNTYYQQGDAPYEGYIVLKFGEDTPRCHDAGVLDLTVVTNATLSTFHNCEIVEGTLYGSVVDGKYNSGFVTGIPATGDFRITLRLSSIANQDAEAFTHFTDARLSIAVANAANEGIGLGVVINDATTTVLGLAKLGETVPINYYSIDRILEDEIIALGYEEATSEWKVYLNNEEVMSETEATIDRNDLSVTTILLNSEQDLYNASINYIAINESNNLFFDGATKLYAYNGSAWINLPESHQRGHSEFYSPFASFNTYAWEFRAYLNTVKNLDNVKLKIISYSSDIMYNGIVYISSNGATPYEEKFEISGANQILYLGDLNADEYTIDFYGDCKKSGIGTIRISISSNDMNTVYISDSTYIKDNTNISVSI